MSTRISATASNNQSNTNANTNDQLIDSRISNEQGKTNINFNFLSSILDKIKGIWKARKEIAYMLSKIFLDASLAVVGLVFVFVPNAPVFMIGGGIFALASVLYTVADAWEFVKSIKKQLNIKKLSTDEIDPEIEFDGITGSQMTQGKGIPEWLNFAAPLLLSLGLLGFGILAFATPALLGMTGLSLVFKICSLVAGTAFGMKALMNLLGCEGSKASSFFKMLLKNAPNVFIYGTGLALGISVLVLNGAFTAIPVVFTLIFALRTVASVLDVFGKNDSTKGIGMVARLIKTISFAVSAVSLGAAAIFFAPAVASFMGVTASFVQIAGGIGCGVCLFAAIVKFMFGFSSDSGKWKFSPCYRIFVKSESGKFPISASLLKNRINDRNSGFDRTLLNNQQISTTNNQNEFPSNIPSDTSSISKNNL